MMWAFALGYLVVVAAVVLCVTDSTSQKAITLKDIRDAEAECNSYYRLHVLPVSAEMDKATSIEVYIRHWRIKNQHMQELMALNAKVAKMHQQLE